MSTSPWASPIVVIIKKNGVDIRLCIDYRLVNSLTRLMIYPMPLINDLLEDLDKVLWYCSLDMDALRPKERPQIYQRMLDNALYGFTKTPRLEGDPVSKHPDLETNSDMIPDEPKNDGKKSVLGRRSYIDDILITAESWDHLCNRFESLLDVCDEWNLSISVVKSFWGKGQMEYLGHKVSSHGLEANPKDLSAPTDLPFPGSLRAMQSFLGSLNYYIVRARSEYADGLTVNEAEYRGLLLCIDLLEGETQQRLVVCGDSNLVIRQVRGEIDCKAPGLTLLRQKALDQLLAWPNHELLHVKRDWNGSADSLASSALQRQAGVEVEEDCDFENLVTLNRLEEILVEEHPTAKICPVATRAAGGSRSRPAVLQEEVVRNLLIERIKQAQDEEVWIDGLKKYLVGAVHELSPEDIKSYNAVGSDYEVDLDGLLFYCPQTDDGRT
ncbi:hypothetical protein PR003_g25647 [Phytophthora rubi]|uniref:RNase H type-1 domain-containing protein n=1 Tax=Phytophthora rubi TaxID=129364 RepID=A0A6A4CMF8_9STRA|nr:hypothetical protein PR003_g25647 [Phytophthora rubi]